MTMGPFGRCDGAHFIHSSTGAIRSPRHRCTDVDMRTHSPSGTTMSQDAQREGAESSTQKDADGGWAAAADEPSAVSSAALGPGPLRRRSSAVCMLSASASLPSQELSITSAAPLRLETEHRSRRLQSPSSGHSRPPPPPRLRAAAMSQRRAANNADAPPAQQAQVAAPAAAATARTAESGSEELRRVRLSVPRATRSFNLAEMLHSNNPIDEKLAVVTAMIDNNAVGRDALIDLSMPCEVRLSAMGVRRLRRLQPLSQGVLRDESSGSHPTSRTCSCFLILYFATGARHLADAADRRTEEDQRE